MKKQNTITYKHSINLGDLYSIFPGLRQIYKDLNKKAIIMQRLNMPGGYYPGAVHPTVHDGVQVTMNKTMFDMAKPLVVYQSYIKDFVVWKGEPVVVDLDKMRSKFVNMPYGSINRWPFYIFTDMATDLSKKWLELPRKKDNRTVGKIVLNFTERYRNDMISYYFLKKYKSKLIFTGTKEEHTIFCDKWELNIPYLVVDNFLELAISINSCKFLLGNQSSAFQIAEGLKKPRIVELCSFAPNVVPHGANGYDFYHQNAVENYVKKLNL